MNTILRYLQEYGQYTFVDKPLNEVDSLILCQLSYLKFDGMVPGIHENVASVTLASLRERDDFDRLFADTRYSKNNREMIDAMLAGRRFSHLKMNCYVNRVEKEWELQFSAITFILDTGIAYVAFRGTDETLVGWKEDFNMGFMKTIPSQDFSTKYLNNVAGRILSNFYVGGHSKGGNLAVYSAMNCNPAFQDRILKVYCLDGPGFRPEVLDRCKYDMIAGRVVKLLPRSSLIGMIFEPDENYEVVESTSSKGGLAQHNLTTWVIVGDKLLRAETLRNRTKFTDRTLNKWVLSLDENQRKTFIEAVYQVATATETDNLIDMAEDRMKRMNQMHTAYKNLDSETQEVIKKVIKILIETAGEQMKEEVSKGGRSIIDGTKDLIRFGKDFLKTIKK